MTARFLIEVPHSAATVECARTVEIFLKSGSHYVTHADWGCNDGVHKSWMVIEAESKDEARLVVPPLYRAQANIVQLNAFTLEEMQEILRHHRS
jgi:hypothetical protein